MTIELTILISIISVVTSIIVSFLTIRRNNKSDAQKGTVEITTALVKLENMCVELIEMKNDVGNVKKEIQEMRERLVKTEGTAKALHRRVDRMEEK